MKELPAIADLNDDQKARLIDASSVLAYAGARMIVSVYPEKDGNATFTVIFNQLDGSGAMVSGNGPDIAAAFDQALPKYRQYRDNPRTITSAVEAVSAIRERVAAGEALDDVLADIKVA